MRIYAIGDIHGQLEKLTEAHDLIARDRAAVGDKTAEVVHVGDFVDRGPDSCGVIQFMIEGATRAEPWVTLLGNHDRMFLGFLSDPDHYDSGLRIGLHWIDPALGGDKTLRSYGVEGAGERLLFDLHEEALRAVPESHRRFVAALPLMHRAAGLVFVHAGIRPGVPLADQVEDDLVWIRRDFLDDRRDHGALVVHGHTPVDRVTHYGNRLSIDTGAGFGRSLSAVVIEDGAVWQLTASGRQPVLPI